ncbi:MULTISPECIES: UDP-N-acetylmuramoyl-L-alanyl-D-glutamate--2,6-diaminopimelate ligase [unclassified Cytobacillus]|uniref:UDP-N-acetylmuramoyl-L-alanyl-D-glutamate--2, 6-diaminopimelate ligase n=1 Tax=unclassified Cytobacillus TaxID=2675268 RepID=UPI0013576590|nr:UDP-N-acetylmuramoyl-L-alanyl-D-glutamate--2,6-diaminopimelate ligase [Cytobacillus sp. AMY 15.2]KAF0820262.1 UDP-N-acetylmuramoyl-dipeptide--2,6- diaminopimelate ligase [Bacillus sp. ZZV12-4809]MCM3089490.1 UDP-N-acetylmuramoyl-L-alanyl-D-glutamate--2,6-diaminopimelate ligase [Cytobacillus sp. AMY 15.2]
MELHKLLRFLQPYTTYKGEDLEITAIVNDNRKVTPGSLFVCIEGYTVDGHDFAGSAAEKGAAAVVAQKELDLDIPVIVVKNTKRALAVLADAFYEQPSKQLHLIGITGTNGKTTTSHLIEKILADAGRKTGLIGTMYTKINDEIFEVKNTTPESLTLQSTFRKMADAGVDSAVMEVSSHALVEGRVHGCDFNIAVFTNLSQDHLDYHKTMDEYRRAKGLLFAQLGSAYNHVEPKYAILNSDDPASAEYETSTSAHVISYGIDQEADLRAINIQMTAAGTEFDLISPFGKYKVSLKMIGKFSIYNVLASIGAGIAAGIPISQIIKSAEEVKGVAGRFETVDAGQNFSVIVDYSHTPDSLKNALETVKQFARKRIFAIVGCGGDRDRSKRPLMAEIACQYSTDPIFTSDNPRSEDPVQILKDMEEGVKEESYKVFVDRKEAIHYAVKNADEGDVILIAGKGHETYQIVGSHVFDFDDRLVAKEAIEER